MSRSTEYLYLRLFDLHRMQGELVPFREAPAGKCSRSTRFCASAPRQARWM
jgi:hypothetical protein